MLAPQIPRSASDYTADHVELVRQTILYVATKLGDLMDEVVVVGGLVPSLLIDPLALPADTAGHVGTMDLDVGLSLALFDEERYRNVSARLREAGFAPDKNESGRETRQRWCMRGAGVVAATIDFLIAPSRDDDQGGRLRNIEADFAAAIIPGMHLAFRDRQRIEITGTTIRGERAVRTVSVCGPGAFVVLKALAFRKRGHDKDAYDLFYVLRNYGAGIAAVVDALRPLLDSAEAREALQILEQDFMDVDGLGPRRTAAFLYRRVDDGVQADVVGFVNALLRGCRD